MCIHVATFVSFEINPYVHVLHVFAYMCIHAATFVSFEINPYVHVLYVLAYMCIHVHTCTHMYATYRPHILFHVSVPTTGPKHPGGGRQPAGPTQDSHEQQPCHFIPRSETRSQTRFGAPVRAARVGEGEAAPLRRPWALHAQRLHGDPILSPVGADLGRWRCA
jgi:hypothetical protein